MRTSLLLAVFVAVLAAFHTVAAQPLPAQPAAGALRVEGAIAPRAGVRHLDLSVEALEELPQRTLTTHVPWTKVAHAYRGPLLRDVLRLAGATGSSLKALALNDYQVLIPVDDALRYDVIIATRIDGEPVPVRKLGPLLVMYPFDADPVLKDRHFYERAIWQLKSIVVQ